MKFLAELLKRILDLFKKETKPKPPASWNGVVLDKPDNVLLYPGRPIRWKTTSGKIIDQFDTGYIDDWFLKVMRAHWHGIRLILIRYIGGFVSDMAFAPVHVQCRVLSVMTPPNRTVAQATYRDDGTPAKVPDHVVWCVTLFGEDGPQIVFGHCHSNDTMRDDGGRPFATLRYGGKALFSWGCNHPHVVMGPDGGSYRVDLRYTGGTRSPVVVAL